ncbi:endolytic transglycosylase MltG [Dictyobacter arantiisoli]|uniref:Endolytic murein transglycosylase n=1 Tax=Dictyobacter arantiisoli TaxID=2014874 RepID=A0A5A5T8Y3_9CHLR|nr:endolytic transglycosylase MltG [Dictyobacter arantiisoli]GCF07449.1 aminodeoxychorismate lyase [Dictyobacter arantiisoli]
MRRRPNSRAAILSVLVVGLIVFIGVIQVWNIASDIFQPASSNAKNVSINIRPGETTTEIANDLQQKGIIRNALAFTIWTRIKGTNLEAGVYKKINASMTISNIIDTLQNGQPDELLVTIPEGKRLEEIARIAAASNLPNFKKADFLNYTRNIKNFPDASKYPLLLSSVPAGKSMEGLLFPDTYELLPTTTARGLINVMLTEMTTSITTNHLAQQAKQHNMDLYSFLTLASIVEREAGKHDDKTKIASVYWNRLYTDVGQAATRNLLQADPTVQYARDTESPPTGAYWQPLANSGGNIAKDSPWNTYVATGLPPTPICSPGLKSLMGAADPAPTHDLYFFAANDDGKTYYFSDLNAFNAALHQHGNN